MKYILLLSILLTSCASKVLVKDCTPTIDGEFWVCNKLTSECEKCK